MIELNKVLLVGRLTRDPETRYTSGGQAVCNFSIAVNRKWKDRQSGERREEVAYIDCETWGPRAEFVQEWFQKGKAIFIEGRLKQDEWTDKQSGQKRSKLLISVDNAGFVGGDKQDGDSQGGNDRREERPQRQREAAPADDSGDTEDDLPF